MSAQIGISTNYWSRNELRMLLKIKDVDKNCFAQGTNHPIIQIFYNYPTTYYNILSLSEYLYWTALNRFWLAILEITFKPPHTIVSHLFLIFLIFLYSIISLQIFNLLFTKFIIFNAINHSCSLTKSSNCINWS